MSKIGRDKKVIRLEPHFKDVLVCKNANFRPYSEIFVEEPENILQKNLGTIAGVFEIVDDSEDSSYIVNYLISVIKKEYYSLPKRGPIESFEAALHKANLALAKLAEHGNVNWIGHINAICLVQEKNNLHLSYTGEAVSFLLRGKTLTSVSETDEDLDPNPLKTFQDVISGRLEYHDKVIIATPQIFDIFSQEEIKRSAIKFSQEEFIRFLKTALINELERAAVLVIDLEEEKEIEPVRQTPTKQKINAFSQKAFVKKDAPAPVPIIPAEEKKQLADELKKELENTDLGLIDKKTGHIYIKEEITYQEDTSNLSDYVVSWKEKIYQSKDTIIPSVKDRLQSLKNISREKAQSWKENINLEKAREKVTSSPIISPRKIITPEKTAAAKEKLMIILSGLASQLKSLGEKTKMLSQRFLAKTIIVLRNLWWIIREKSTNFKEKVIRFIINYRNKRAEAKLNKVEKIIVHEEPRISEEITSKPAATIEEFLRKEESTQTYIPETKRESEYIYSPGENSDAEPLENILDKLDQLWRKLLSVIGFLIPNFSRIKTTPQYLDRKKKISAILILIAIFVVPYIYLKWEKGTQQNETVAQTPTPVVIDPLEQDKNVKKIATVNSIYSGGNISNLVNVNGITLAVAEDKIIDLENNKEYAVADDFKKPDLVTNMDDLNLLFLIKGNKILSFSPLAGKFQDNNITIPEGAKIVSARTYLTYLYLLDTTNNQIYRYPRAEGGFGEKMNWLKDSSLNFSSAKEMAISDNVFVSDGKIILEIAKGKNQDFSVESTATPIVYSKLYAKEDGQNIYILDTTNSRIIMVDMSGKIINQFYHPDLKSAVSFTVNEDKSTIYFSDGNKVSSFEMN